MLRVSEGDYRKISGKPPSAAPKRAYDKYLTHRTDGNQKDIVKSFRKLGFMVQPLHGVGQGCPDIAVCKGGARYGWRSKTA